MKNAPQGSLEIYPRIFFTHQMGDSVKFSKKWTRSDACRRVLVGAMVGAALAGGGVATAAAAPQGELPPVVAKQDGTQAQTARAMGPDYWINANGVRFRSGPGTGYSALFSLNYGNGLNPICWHGWYGDNVWLKSTAWGSSRVGYVHWRLIHVGNARPPRCPGS